jgi:hypothetical protein
MFSHWRSRDEARLSRIYLDAGEHERFDTGTFVLDYGRDTGDFFRHLRGLGYSDDELRLVLERNGRHSEIDWRRRLPGALAWVLS